MKKEEGWGTSETSAEAAGGQTLGGRVKARISEGVRPGQTQSLMRCGTQD